MCLFCSNYNGVIYHHWLFCLYELKSELTWTTNAQNKNASHEECSLGDVDSVADGWQDQTSNDIRKCLDGKEPGNRALPEVQFGEKEWRHQFEILFGHVEDRQSKNKIQENRVFQKIQIHNSYYLHPYRDFLFLGYFYWVFG